MTLCLENLIRFHKVKTLVCLMFVDPCIRVQFLQ